MGIIDESRPNLLWITDFPLFEYDEEEDVYKRQPITRSILAPMELWRNFPFMLSSSFPVY